MPVLTFVGSFTSASCRPTASRCSTSKGSARLVAAPGFVVASLSKGLACRQRLRPLHSGFSTLALFSAKVRYKLCP